MSLSDALSNPPAKNKIDKILSNLQVAERSALSEALSAPSIWPHSALARVITDKVSPVSEAAVRRYRRDVLGIAE